VITHFNKVFSYKLLTVQWLKMLFVWRIQ